MIDNKLISSKAVLAKIIADLDLKEDEIRITDVREWIGEAMENIKQQTYRQQITKPNYLVIYID